MNAQTSQQQYLLPMKTVLPGAEQRVVNVASIPQRSPFRYPGGKTWFVPMFRKWILSKGRNPKVLIEPFAGGGIIGLTAAFESLADEVLLVERDEQVAAVWETMLNGDAEWLSRKIMDFELTRDNLLKQLGKKNDDAKEVAFRTILKNRTFHGGILADGSGLVKFGENGKGILSRWYPETLARRIREIGHVSGRIKFMCGDGIKVLKKNIADKSAVFFIDPPHTAGGKRAGARLYKYFDIDHEELFRTCSKLKGDFIMTYDNAPEVEKLASRYGLKTKPIAMKNTHHNRMTELMIAKNFSWLN
jgi:DNA adenine methylase